MANFGKITNIKLSFYQCNVSSNLALALKVVSVRTIKFGAPTRQVLNDFLVHMQILTNQHSIVVWYVSHVMLTTNVYYLVGCMLISTCVCMYVYMYVLLITNITPNCD